MGWCGGFGLSRDGRCKKRRLKPTLQAKARATRARLFAGLLVTASLLAQEPTKFSVRSDLVFLPTRVQDRKGDTVYGLRPEQFMVEDNGVRQAVNVDEDPESSGVSLVVAVECGRSAALEFKKLKGLGAMIGGIVGDAPHEVAILSYGVGPYVLSDFSRSSDGVPVITRLLSIRFITQLIC